MAPQPRPHSGRRLPHSLLGGYREPHGRHCDNSCHHPGHLMPSPNPTATRRANDEGCPGAPLPAAGGHPRPLPKVTLAEGAGHRWPGTFWFQSASPQMPIPPPCEGTTLNLSGAGSSNGGGVVSLFLQPRCGNRATLQPRPHFQSLSCAWWGGVSEVRSPPIILSLHAGLREAQKGPCGAGGREHPWDGPSCPLLVGRGRG